MLVADAIAMRGNVEAGHAFHEACRQASEAAVAERRVRLQGNDPLQVDAQLGKGLAGFSSSLRLPRLSSNRRPMRNSRDR